MLRTTVLLTDGTFAPYKYFCEAKILAQGEFISPEHVVQKVWRQPLVAGIQKERYDFCRIFLFWKGWLKSIFLNREKCRPQGGPPTASPAQRVAVGKEEQGSGRMTSFLPQA